VFLGLHSSAILPSGSKKKCSKVSKDILIPFCIVPHNLLGKQPELPEVLEVDMFHSFLCSLGKTVKKENLQELRKW
jgi:hypothetical protein